MLEHEHAARATKVVRDLWLAAGADPEAGSFTEGGGDSLSALRLLGAVHRDLGVRMRWSDLDAASSADDFAARPLCPSRPSRDDWAMTRPRQRPRQH